jgi:hypothetical protein
MSVYAGPEIADDGLVLYLDAANPKSYPGSGTTWTNLRNLSLNATLVNGVGYSTQNLGILTLDGSNDIISAPSLNTFGAIPNHAFEIWMKSSGLGPGKSRGGLMCPDYGIITDIDGNGNVRYNITNTDNWPTSVSLFNRTVTSVNVFDNNWHHIVCTRNSSTYDIYIDGISRATGSGGGTWSGLTIWSGMSFSIGNNPNDVFYNLLGNIALAKMYNVYLTAQEVQQNFNATKSRYGL